MKTKIRQTSFSPRGNILGLINAAQLQRRSTDAVMIPADVLTTHFGIHRRCAATASEHRRCNDYSQRFNRTFCDTLTLHSYSVGAPTL